MRKRDRLDGAPTTFERIDEWGDRHVLLGCLGTFLACSVGLLAVTLAYAWLEDQGTGGTFVLGLIVGALVGGGVVYSRMRDRPHQGD